MENQLFKNKYLIPSTRLTGYNYAQAGYYFVTICTKNKFNYFGEIINNKMILNDLGKIALEEVMKTPQIRTNIKLDEFVIMPNHIHIILIIKNINTVHYNYKNMTVETHCNASLPQPSYKNKFGPQQNNLSSIIRGIKSVITKTINIKYGHNYFAWQTRFHDHIIRNEQSLNNIRKYIHDNPTTWYQDINYTNK